jgi:hypothetical protein
MEQDVMSATTSNRGYPYPQNTDTVDVPGDVEALAEAIDTDVDGLLDSYLVPVKTTGAGCGTTASGFTVATVFVRTALNGKLVNVRLDTVNTSGITATAGDITDTTIFTLNSSFWPTEFHNVHWSAGSPNGDMQVNVDGTLVIRSANVTVPASSNIRTSFTFLRD